MREDDPSVKLPSWFKRLTTEDLKTHEGFVVVGIERDVVEDGDAAEFVQFLADNFMRDAEALQRYRECLDFAWEGYEDDDRELWQIPEVASFVDDLNRRWPYALYFLSRQGNGLQVMQFVLTGATVASASPSGDLELTYDSSQLNRLLVGSWFPAMNELCARAGLGGETVDAMSSSAQSYLQSGPA
jgi:hypothetical protein